MEAGRYYHVYNHANGHDNLFIEDENYTWFLHQYRTYIHPIAETYAYCLMPNHFHFLIRIRDAGTLLQNFPKFNTLEMLESASLPGKQFSNLFSSYTQAFNKRFNRKGSLFLKNFKRKRIDTDAYFSALVGYIHFNPVTHGFSEAPQNWKWSSYQTLVSSKPTNLERSIVLKWFGGKDGLKIYHDNYREISFPEITYLEHWFKLG